MNTSRLSAVVCRPSLARPRGATTLMAVVLLVGVVCAVGGLVWFSLRPGNQPETDDVIVRAVFRGPYQHIVLEQGQVESSHNVEIRCEVKSRAAGGTEILWVIDEGTLVKQGDKLVQLDSSALDREQVEQQIVCNTGQAAVIQADNTLQAAKIARLEYLEGSFKQEEQTFLSEIFVAEETLRRAQLAYQSTERLAAKGVVTALQLEGDQFAVDKAKNALEGAGPSWRCSASTPRRRCSNSSTATSPRPAPSGMPRSKATAWSCRSCRKSRTRSPSARSAPRKPARSSTPTSTATTAAAAPSSSSKPAPPCGNGRRSSACRTPARCGSRR